MPRASIDAILTGHFLRRFLENDLISPDADRLQLLAVVGASLLSATLFISLFMAANYVGVPHTPGQLAVAALNDQFFYVSLSMIVVALIAVSQWDALVVDARDAAILEPLPIRPLTVRRAKLAAVTIFGGAVSVALNVVPSVIYPWLLVYHTRLSVFAMGALMLAHLTVTIMAAGFAYLSVIAVRETLATIMPGRLFARISPWVQGVLIVLLGTALLLVPPTSSDTSRRGFAGWRGASPPLWFVGAHEYAVGSILIDQPRGRLTPRQAKADPIMTAVYRRHQQAFPMLARRGLFAFAAVLLIAAAAYLWNPRRLTVLAPPPAAAVRRRWTMATRVATTFLVRESTTRAGFFFTMAALWRSNVHRLTIACAGAAGLAMAVVALSNTSLQEAASRGVAPTRLLVVQPLLYGALLIAFRHAIRVPAELRANWGFQLAWREHERRFLAGARRAALVSLALPAIAVCFPLVAYVLGPQQALIHALLGVAGAVAFVEALLVGYDKVPFTCTYLPNENMKAFGILYLLAFVIGASTFARMQSAALADGRAAIQLLVILAVAFGVARVMSNRSARPEIVDFNEAPATTQRLGLHT